MLIFDHFKLNSKFLLKSWFLILAVTAIFSWAVILSDIDIWSALLNPGYAFERYVFAIFMAIILGAPFAGGILCGLILLVLASDIGFVVALLRGYLSSHFGQDCADFCFGFLNRILGLGCGSAGEGCAFEIYLLAFIAVELVFLMRHVFLRQRSEVLQFL